MQAVWGGCYWVLTGNKIQSAFRSPSAHSLHSHQKRFLQLILQGLICLTDSYFLPQEDLEILHAGKTLSDKMPSQLVK